MAMDRLLEVSNAWNWLPAFRVVAEYESIQKAAVVLNVSASALSRTVRLLEEAVGQALFFRGPSGLTLTQTGAELLGGTRDAMRRIDDVLIRRPSPVLKVFTGAASGAVLPRLLAAAMARLVPAHPNVAYRTTQVADDAVLAELLRGNLDVALVEDASELADAPGAIVAELGSLELAIVAPRGASLDPASVDAPIVVLSSMTFARPAAVAIAASIDDAERFALAGPFLALLPPSLASDRFEVVARATEGVSVWAVYRSPLATSESALGALVLGLVSEASNLIAVSRNDSNGPFA